MNDQGLVAEQRSRSRSRWSSLKNTFSVMGPIMVIGAMQLGPGSVITGATAGAELGYGIIWLIAASTVFMLVFVDMGVRIGISYSDSPMTAVRNRLGGPVTALVGVAFFFMAIMYLTGSLAGASIGLSLLFPGDVVTWSIIAGLASVAFVWMPHAYSKLEKVMIGAVLLMAIVFGVTAIMSRPDISSLAAGFVPSSLPGGSTVAISILGTNMTLYAAFYAGYAIREKKTLRRDYRKATFVDTMPGILSSGIIMIFITIAGAAVLAGRKVDDPADIVSILEPTVGVFAAFIFAIGIFAAGMSSVLGNAAVGGTVPTDSVGRGGSLGRKAVKIVGTVVIAISIIIMVTFGGNPVPLVLLVNALSVIVFPLLGLLMMVLANSTAMGDLTNKWWQNIMGAMGLLLVVWGAVTLLMDLLA